MQSALARTTIRAASRAATGKRNSSLLASMRSFSRTFESHGPSVLQKPQPGDYSKLAGRAVRNFVFIAPALTSVLFWPVLARASLEGRL